MSKDSGPPVTGKHRRWNTGRCGGSDVRVGDDENERGEDALGPGGRLHEAVSRSGGFRDVQRSRPV